MSQVVVYTPATLKAAAVFDKPEDGAQCSHAVCRSASGTRSMPYYCNDPTISTTAVE